ncbi:aspartyl protease-domain-containing protein [Jimgerdemannia flammicorona]|uniref:DNA damage-inducible protein 1 n=1 Tax=Jimgerdemannia flammicorona TaxID=994334 RepID=A0A433D736_9FUNG|nr:aspartyl protease-domain-containing protein [Jimgerdemannia flammicorona]
MRLSITTEKGDLYNLEIDSQMELENFMALIEAESTVPPEQQSLFHNGRELTDIKQTLQQYGVVQDDILLLRRKAPRGGPPAGMLTPTFVRFSCSGNPNFDMMRQHVLRDPRLLQQLANTNPELARAALNDPERFVTMVQQIEQNRRQAESQRAVQMAALEDDPFDVEAQRRIEAAIQAENIAANLEAAMEFNPESFARVTRLYIAVEINGRKLVALVDSGAQSTVISPEMAESCGLLRLMDTRFSGVAEGVGTAKILGRIHSTQMKLGKDLFLACSFIVVEGRGTELLFGLDMLKKHQASIDLKKDALIINDTEIPFLLEHELPEKQRMIEVHGGADPKGNPSKNGDSSSSSRPEISPPNPAREPPVPAVAAIPAPGPAPSYPEETIQILVNLGVPRQEAIQALEMTGGNADMAASLLFQG